MTTMTLQKHLTINEIFYSIQGESYLAGLPCIFVRLTGCHQRCTYCDSEYAFYEGKKVTLGEIMDQIQAFPCHNILLTGGEPLLQGNCPLLAQLLLDAGYQVAIETSGNRDISCLPLAVIKIMDLKTPASHECHRNNYDNLKFLQKQDEIKFVVMNESDTDWALDLIRDKKLEGLCHLSLSPTDKTLLPVIADRILKSGLPVRLQIQFHKMIWPQKDRGF